MTIRNGVQLIVYADRFGGTIPGSAQVIDAHFGDAVTGVHYLPFYIPYDGADAGFDPIDHSRPDPRLGTWDDLKAAGRTRDLCADVIVNHMSSQSAQFLDFTARGDASPYSELFLTYDRVFPDGATAEDLLRLYRPRPGLPFTTGVVRDGRRLLWTTFTPEQVDIDVESDAGREYLRTILDRLAESGVRLIRLDAVGYAIKRAGTASFMLPETFEFIDDFSRQAHGLGLEVLVEVHSHFRTQIEIAERVDWVYDFALPPLLLHTLFTGDSRALRGWVAERPVNAITVLDTHDGIGVIDVGSDSTGQHGAGLLEEAEVDALVRQIHTNTRFESADATGAAASNVDLYQVNSTYYDALGQDDEAYLIARAVQFFLPGIPQVYYVGALAGSNDMDLLASTGVGRDINRHHYTGAEIARETERPVVQSLIALMRLRSTHAAFTGRFEFTGDEDRIILRWSTDSGDTAELDFAPLARSAVLSWTDESGSRRVTRLASLFSS